MCLSHYRNIWGEGFPSIHTLEEKGVNLVFTLHAPPNSLIDSNVSPKVNTIKGEIVGTRSLVHSILGVERRVGALGWD
jgi:hypothetical protein